MRPVFTQERVTDSATLFIEGLLSTSTRKTSWERAKFSGDPGPWRQQALLGRAHWRADVLLDLVREYVLEHFSEKSAVLVLRETHFPKQGHSSCGVAGQFVSSHKKSINCQVGLFLAYVSSHGAAFLDRALYLPRDWMENPERRATVHIPEGLEFSSKPLFAITMVRRALAANVSFAWITSSPEYTSEALAELLIENEKCFVLPVASSTVAGNVQVGTDLYPVTSTCAHPAQADGDWSWIPVCQHNALEPSRNANRVAGLLLREAKDGGPCCYRTWAPSGTSIQSLVTVLTQQQRVDAAFETAKNMVGLDHNESRSWHGWYRHVTLAMLAYAVMVVECGHV